MAVVVASFVALLFVGGGYVQPTQCATQGGSDVQWDIGSWHGVPYAAYSVRPCVIHSAGRVALSKTGFWPLRDPLHG